MSMASPWRISRRIFFTAMVGLLFTLGRDSSAGESVATKPVLVELFTSEDCSSCPPADALLRTLDSTQPVPGIQLIVLGEHVDYWDDLGWKDAYSAHAFTLRQQAYADRLRLASPSTPQMVVDGTVEFVETDRERANRAFEKARAPPMLTLRISSLNSESGPLRDHVDTDPSPPQGEVFVALALVHSHSP